MSDLWGNDYLIQDSNNYQGFSGLIFMEFREQYLCTASCRQHKYIENCGIWWFISDIHTSMMLVLTLMLKYIIISTKLTSLANIKKAGEQIPVEIFPIYCKQCCSARRGVRSFWCCFLHLQKIKCPSYLFMTNIRFNLFPLMKKGCCGLYAVCCFSTSSPKSLCCVLAAPWLPAIPRKCSLFPPGLSWLNYLQRFISEVTNQKKKKRPQARLIKAKNVEFWWTNFCAKPLICWKKIFWVSCNENLQASSSGTVCLSWLCAK